MENIFSSQKVNCGRQSELDIAKGLAIAFMVLVHTFELFSGDPFPQTASSHIIEFLGSPPAAPVFMLLLGVGIVYSKRTSAAFLFKRGIIILIMAYALGLFRDVIPSFISSVINEDSEIFKDGVLELLGVDILQFAGLTFLFFALVIKLKLKIWQIFSCAIVFSAIGAILGETSTGIFGLDVLAGLFWGSWDRSWFPFFSWIFFPVSGYIFGTVLMHCNNKTDMYKRILIISAVLLIPLTVLSYNYGIKFGAFGDLWQQQYYHQDLFGNIVLTVFSLFWISLLYFLTLPFKNRGFNTLSRWSKNVNQIYIAHWIILGILVYIFMEGPLSIRTIVGMSAVILIASDLIAYLYLKLKPNYFVNKQNAQTFKA
ncbi:MAG: Acyltransferase family protein [Firmicutes bacterium ADurb.Bin193]|nr:MAG: Acyltransferase family protein [Firmicutes bacterium ADurb.Bin193]